MRNPHGSTRGTGNPRSAALMMAAACTSVVLACGYLVLAFQIVFSMRIGPTAVVLTSDRGIHTGDMLALPVVLMAVSFLAVAVLCIEQVMRRPTGVVIPTGWERRRRERELSRLR